MLFMAVFCGFLAEYQLEHKIENDRAKELAKSFYEELVEDSIRLNNIMELRENKISSIQYLIRYFKSADFSKETDSAFRSMSFAYLTVSGRVIFEPSEGILNQLQNSGSRRYFKSQHLQDAISKLAYSIRFVKIRNDREMDYITGNLRPFCLQHLDYQWVNEFLSNGTINLTDAYLNRKVVDSIKPFIKNPQQLNRVNAINLAGQYLVMMYGMKNGFIPDYRKAASKTMQLLREEYPDLKNSIFR